jgi:hypothetical protein
MSTSKALCDLMNTPQNIATLTKSKVTSTLTTMISEYGLKNNKVKKRLTGEALYDVMTGADSINALLVTSVKLLPLSRKRKVVRAFAKYLKFACKEALSEN